jgi:hypothetical protein
VGFESTIPVFEPVKTFHALDCAATVIDNFYVYYLGNRRFQKGNSVLIGVFKQHPALDMEVQKNHDYLTFGYPIILVIRLHSKLL